MKDKKFEMSSCQNEAESMQNIKILSLSNLYTVNLPIPASFAISVSLGCTEQLRSSV